MAGEELEVNPRGGRVVVGRGPGVDCFLGHPSIAPRHATVYRSDPDLWVAPLQGKVLVNGRPIKRPTRLSAGDRVQLGQVELLAEAERLVGRQEAALTLLCEGVVVAVGEKRPLAGVWLTVERGEFVALLGPSGAGKSTLLRVLVGYQEPSAGRARAGPYELPAQAAWLWARAGYVAQQDVLFASLTTAEHLDYALRLRQPGLPAASRKEAIAQRLDQVGLKEYAGTPVRSLSGGQKKRVAVAQELVTNPEILFLDEPTAGLDPANELRLVVNLRRIAESGITVVCATHVMESVQEFRRAVMLVEGRIAFDRPPKELLGHFEVETYPELYDPARLARMAAPGRPGPERPPSPVSAPPAPAGPWRQAATLAGRGLKLLARDRRWALMLVFQPFFIGLIINLSQCQPARILAIPTFAAVAAVWLGLNNTARELVRERRQYARERLVGVTPFAYVLAKVGLFAAVGACQVLVLVVVLWHMNCLHPTQQRELLSDFNRAAVFGALFLAYLGGSLVGLTVSAWADTQEWAVATLPILVLPQLLLTGEASGLHGRDQFQSAVHLVQRYRAPGSLPWREVAVEGASLLTFTRPAIALLKPPPIERPDRRRTAINLTHLLLLVALSTAAMAAVFRWRERHWLMDSTSGHP